MSHYVIVWDQGNVSIKFLPFFSHHKNFLNINKYSRCKENYFLLPIMDQYKNENFHPEMDILWTDT